MRTNLITFVMETETRIQIVKTLFEYPARLWSCSTLEDITSRPHATVFRTLQELLRYGLFKPIRINRKDVAYELVQNSPWTRELKRILSLDQELAKEVAVKLINQIMSEPTRSDQISSILLYGSSISGEMKPESDIDLLIILKKHNPKLEKEIQEQSAKLSSDINKSISATIMSAAEVKKERKKIFLQSVKQNKEVLYGETPF